MSNMIPKSLVDTLRTVSDVSVDIYGQEVSLYVPSNWEAVDVNDVYSEPQDYEYDEYSTKAFIHWSPSKQRLIKYGIFVEKDIPIICYFSNKIKDDSGFKHFKEIPQNSYIRVPMKFVPNKYESDNFEVVNITIDKMQDAVVRKFYKLVPGRVKGRG